MITKTIEELRKDLDSKKVTSKELVKESRLIDSKNLLKNPYNILFVWTNC